MNRHYPDESFRESFIAGPVEVPRQFHQLVQVVADGSGSMASETGGGISKAQAVSGAVRDLFTRLKVSRRAANFSAGVITFDGHVQTRLPQTPVSAVDDNGNFDPMQGHGGGTAVYAALEEAERQVQLFLRAAPEHGVPTSAVILLMSDGACGMPDRTREVATRLKFGENGSRIVIATTLFSQVGHFDSVADQLLRDVATDPVRYYKTVYDAQTLRDFLLASASMASGGIAIDPRRRSLGLDPLRRRPVGERRPPRAADRSNSGVR